MSHRADGRSRSSCSSDAPITADGISQGSRCACGAGTHAHAAVAHRIAVTSLMVSGPDQAATAVAAARPATRGCTARAYGRTWSSRPARAASIRPSRAASPVRSPSSSSRPRATTTLPSPAADVADRSLARSPLARQRRPDRRARGPRQRGRPASGRSGRRAGPEAGRWRRRRGRGIILRLPRPPRAIRPEEPRRGAAPASHPVRASSKHSAERCSSGLRGRFAKPRSAVHRVLIPPKSAPSQGPAPTPSYRLAAEPPRIHHGNSFRGGCCRGSVIAVRGSDARARARLARHGTGKPQHAERARLRTTSALSRGHENAASAATATTLRRTRRHSDLAPRLQRTTLGFGAENEPGWRRPAGPVVALLSCGFRYFSSPRCAVRRALPNRRRRRAAAGREQAPRASRELTSRPLARSARRTRSAEPSRLCAP